MPARIPAAPSSGHPDRRILPENSNHHGSAEQNNSNT